MVLAGRWDVSKIKHFLDSHRKNVLSLIERGMVVTIALSDGVHYCLVL